MSDYRLSRLAESDLAGIAEFTIRRFGIDKAREYRDSLKLCFDRLANNKRMGRRAEQLAPGLRYFEHQAHIIFYTFDEKELFVVRILHSRMDVQRYF